MSTNPTVKVLPLPTGEAVSQFVPLEVDIDPIVMLLTDPDEAVTVTVCDEAEKPGPAVVNRTGLGLKLSVWALAVSGLPKRTTAANAKTSVKCLILRKVISKKELRAA